VYKTICSQIYHLSILLICSGVRTHMIEDSYLLLYPITAVWFCGSWHGFQPGAILPPSGAYLLPLVPALSMWLV